MVLGGDVCEVCVCVGDGWKENAHECLLLTLTKYFSATITLAQAVAIKFVWICCDLESPARHLSSISPKQRVLHVVNVQVPLLKTSEADPRDTERGASGSQEAPEPVELWDG